MLAGGAGAGFGVLLAMGYCTFEKGGGLGARTNESSGSRGQLQG